MLSHMLTFHIFAHMKRKIAGFILLMLLTLGAGAQEKVKWYNIQEAIELAQDEPRIMVIDVYTDWCGWCKRLDATTFADPEVVSVLNEHFYPVKLDAEGKQDIQIGDNTYKFVDNGRRGYHEVAAIVTRGRLVYPTISYLSGQGKVLEVAAGYVDASAFKVYLNYFKDGAYESQDFEEYKLLNAPETGQPQAQR